MYTLKLLNSIIKRLLMLAIVSTFFCCTKTLPKTELLTQSETVAIMHDTIVEIAQLQQFKSQIVATNKMADNTLKNYFKSKGFLLQSEINDNINLPRLPQNKDKNVIEFVGVDWFNNMTGVIYYYNAPVGAVGHCVQPHNAIISNSENGLTISNEEFLPTNFSIDSVKTIDNKYIIYANDYDCFNKVVLKKYRVELKK